jgi:parallel beta-helix repeat protein
VSAGGPTYVSWVISNNTTWTAANSPYIVTGNILVDKNASLTIDPGVTIKFAGNYYMRIEGGFSAVGTENNRIVFTSNKTTPSKNQWDRIKIVRNSENSKIFIKHSTFQYGNEFIEVDRQNPTVNIEFIISNNIFQNSSGAIEIVGEHNDFINITDNLFQDVGSAISAGGGGNNLNIDISNNIFQNVDSSISTGSYGDQVSIQIHNNSFNNCSTGIVCNSEKSLKFDITKNRFYNNEIGIHCKYGLINISENMIKSNNNGILLDENSPHSHEANTRVERNVIQNNSKGITIGKYNFPIFVKNNNIEQSKEYQLYHNGLNDYNITNNWWGTTNTDSINQSIFDYYDDFNYGKITYTPFLTSPVDINFTNLCPTAYAGPDQNTYVNQTVNFDGSGSYDPDGDMLTYKWNFNDGTITSWQNSSKTSHKFSSVGNYIVTLTVSDGRLTDSDTCIILVSKLTMNNTRPFAFAGPDQNATVNKIVNFDGSDSYDPDGDLLTYKWDFGDGSSKNGRNFSKTSHRYKNPGNYTVKLTVSDGSLTDMDNCIVQVVGKVDGNGTKVSGVISTDITWTEANSPYNVTDSIFVNKGVNLTIEPGVKVKFNKYCSLRIEGTLYAEGTKNKMITFTSTSTNDSNHLPTPGEWGTIEFMKNAGEGSLIKYCKIEGANLAIEISQTDLKCTPNILNNIITNNNGGILYGPSFNNITIAKYSKQISFNTITNNLGSGITIDTNYIKNIFVNNNIIRNNSNYGICCVGNNENYYLTNNIVEHNKFGILFHTKENITISNNTIINNEKSGISYGGSGFNRRIIEKNIISLNGIGISFYETTTYESNISFNNIYNNTQYNIKNEVQRNNGDLNLQNNWWGTTNTDLINQSIYDYYDDFELSKIFYKPFLTSPVDISFQPPPDDKSNRPPIAIAGPDQYIKKGELINLNGSASYDPDGDDLTFRWDSNIDGKIGDKAVVINILLSLGNHTITLMVTDGMLKSVDTCFVYVSDQQDDTSSQDQQNDTSPTISSSNVQNNSQNMSILNSKIKITFSQSMNRSSVEAAIKVSPLTNYSLYWGKDDTELLIVFSENLLADTDYTITIDTTAKDKEGYNLNDPYKLKFTTEVKEKQDDGDGQPLDNFYLIAIIISMIVIIIILSLLFISKNRKRAKEGLTRDKESMDTRQELNGVNGVEEYYTDEDSLNGSDEFVNELIDEALSVNKPSDFDLTKEEMLNQASMKYSKGEISKATYMVLEKKLIKKY